MAGRGIIPPSGPVGANIGRRRDLSQSAGLANAAYRPVDMAGRSSPTTVPLGEATALTAGTTQGRANIARLKGLDDDIDVASIAAFAGSPAAGTETLGVALYEVVGTPADYPGRERNGIAFTLRLIPGCEWFTSVASGANQPITFRPSNPVKLERSKSYAAAVVWSTNSLLAGSAVVKTLYLNETVTTGFLGGAITSATGFPPEVPVDEFSLSGVAVDQVAFRVRVDPVRPVANYQDFY